MVHAMCLLDNIFKKKLVKIKIKTIKCLIGNGTWNW